MNDQKKYILAAALTVALLSSGTSVLGEKVPFERLPERVQKAAKAYAGSARIEDVDRNREDGDYVYEIAFKRDGEHVELRVNEEGQVIGGAEELAPRTPLPNEKEEAQNWERVRQREVPSKVQEALNEESQGRPVLALRKRPVDVYIMEFDQNGESERLMFTADGEQVEATDDFLDQDAQFDRHLSDAQKVELNQVPAAVAKTIQERAQRNRIEDIDRGRLGGRMVYQAAFKLDDRHTELRVAENGQFLGMQQRGGKSQRFGMGEEERIRFRDLPAPVRSGFQRVAQDAVVTEITKSKTGLYLASIRGSRRGDNLKILENGLVVQPQSAAEEDYTVPLSGAKKVEWRQLPSPVQETIRREAGTAAIEVLQVGTWSGRTIYQAAFKRDGQHEELQVTEQGSIVRGVAGAENR